MRAEGERGCGEFPWKRELRDGLGGTRSEDAEQAVVRGGVEHLHVVGDDVFLQPLGDGGGVTRFEVEEQFVSEAVEVQVAVHLALGVDERSVTALADAEALHVICHLAVEELHAVCAHQTKAAAAA
jgi:hypothetical protein